MQDPLSNLNIEILQPKLDDGLDIHILRTKCSESYSNFNITFQEASEIWARNVNFKKNICFIAKHNGCIVGASSISFDKARFMKETVLIGRIWYHCVDPQFRMRSIGKELWKAQLQKMKEYNLSYVFDHIQPNDCIKGFYEKMGFTPYLKKQKAYDPYETYLFDVKNLRDPSVGDADLSGAGCGSSASPVLRRVRSE